MKPLVTLRTVPRTVVVGAWCVAGFLVMMVGGSFTEALFSRVGYPGAGWGGVPVTFDLAGKEMIQMYGGVGYTWEYDCHLFYRRAKLLSLALGGTGEWRERLIERLAR